MKTVRLSALALASVFLTSIAHAQFATSVVAYQPGAGFSPGYTNAAAALGEPSRVTPGAFGGPVTPFNPPYLPAQLVSIGEGGSLTVKFDRPVLNHPRNPWSIDFIIYGNPGFIITNEFDFNTFDWVGIPATDGSTFGANHGETRVSVSMNGVHFFELDPVHAPTVDSGLPTDGAGNFSQPAHPNLTPADCAGLTEEQIRALYNGAAGGTGYNISTARTRHGHRVMLPFISYVRIEVLSGKSDVDGIAAVFVPPGHVRTLTPFARR